MNEHNSGRADFDHTVTRRTFIGTTALGSGALLSGGLISLLQRSASAAGDFQFVDGAKDLRTVDQALFSYGWKGAPTPRTR